MKHLNRMTPYLAIVWLTAQVFLIAPAEAQVTYLEAEVSGGANDTFGLAEDCRQLGSRFVIKGMVHPPGNTSSDDEWYMFDGDAGACLDIDVTITQPISTSSALYQLNVWLFDSSQTMVAAWNTSNGQSSASFGIGAYTLPATDTYYVYVTEWSVSPNALTQPGLVFSPLSVRGFGVTGATPDSTRNTAGGNQTFGSLYEITVSVSSGNEAPFDVWIDCDPNTGAFTCSPDPATVCSSGGGSTSVVFRASLKCPSAGLGVSILGGSLGGVSPGGFLMLSAPGPGIASPYTVDDGTGPQPCGQIHVVRALVTRNGQTVSHVQACSAHTTCLDVCAQLGSTYFAALSLSSVPPIPIGPFLPALELDITDILFVTTFPVNQLFPVLSGLNGQPGLNQICINLPPAVIMAPLDVHLQVVTFSSGLVGLSPKVTVHLLP